jgi:iron-sulfur cluster assembly protein
MPITLTERAARHVERYLSSHDGNGLRVGVKPTGCSGYMYVVQPAKEIGDHDQVFTSQGIQIVVDDESLKYLEGTEVDFAREGLNEGFRFANPNVKATCGCGESFSL